MSDRRLMTASSSHVNGDGMITDSWASFIKNVKSGKAPSVYSVGNYIPLDLGSHGLLNMEIIAFNPPWLKCDRSGTPNIALFSKELLNDTLSSLKSGDCYSGDFPKLVQWYESNIYPDIPSIIQQNIVPIIIKTDYWNSGWVTGGLNTKLFSISTTALKNFTSHTTGFSTDLSSTTDADAFLDWDKTKIKKKKANGTDFISWLCMEIVGFSWSLGGTYFQYIAADGSTGKSRTHSQNTSDSNSMGIPLGFCL